MPVYPDPRSDAQQLYPPEQSQGYPPVAPPRGYPSSADTTSDARYGAVGVVPWTFRQTLIGTLATLVPWALFLIVSQVLSAGSSTSASKPLSQGADLASAVVVFIFSGVVEFAFVLAPAYYTVRRRAPGVSVREGLAALGLRGVRPLRAVVAVVIGVAIILAASILYSVLINAFNLPLRTNSDALLQQARFAPITTISLLIGAVLIAPFCEEVFFRGFLVGGLLRRMPGWGAVLASALVFGGVHGDFGSFAVLFVIGLVLATVRWKVGSLWPSIVIHAANNALAAITVILVIIGLAPQ